MNPGVAKVSGAVIEFGFERVMLNCVPQIETDADKYFRQVVFR